MATLTTIKRSEYLKTFHKSSYYRDLNSREVLPIDQSLKMQTDMNGSSIIINTNKSIDEGSDEMEGRLSRYSLNTHE
jgi:hypothetical protein